ncbi:MAG: transcription elongation factor GreA [Parcubacteria group bacterium]|nr:transcription elongation factor GreA [Parcubacteria group bacterium]
MVQYFTSEGLKKIRDELEYRKTNLRAEIAIKIQDAKELGDISENAEYQEAIMLQSFNEGKIEELEETLKNAVIVEEDSKNHTHFLVEIRSTVKVSSKHGNQQFTIVGSSESDPSKGFVSNESPLGKAFLGHVKDEEVEVMTPKGKIVYKILEIL